MRMVALIFALVCALCVSACARLDARTTESSSSRAPESGATKLSGAETSPAAAAADLHAQASTNSATAPAKVDFPTQIRPILEARCQPCHFSGGKVYQHLPFDRPETIKTLGTKLFTRIKDENERRLIRDYLAQD